MLWQMRPTGPCGIKIKTSVFSSLERAGQERRVRPLKILALEIKLISNKLDKKFFETKFQVGLRKPDQKALKGFQCINAFNA